MKKNIYQPKTGQKCTCKPGQHRDNCPECEGTGWRIDFKAIREHAAQRPSSHSTTATDPNPTPTP